VRENDQIVIAKLGERSHVHAETKIDAARFHGAEERLEEDAAVKADAVERGLELRVTKLHDRAAARALHDERVDARAALEDRRDAPEPLEHEHARRLHHDPRADGPRIGNALEENDVMARARKEERARAPGRP